MKRIVAGAVAAGLVVGSTAWAECPPKSEPLQLVQDVVKQAQEQEEQPCLFGTFFPELRDNLNFELGNGSPVYIDGLTELEKKQILKGMASSGATTLEEAFDNDDGEFTVRSLVSKNSDHDAFTLYQYSAGNSNPHGFIFTQDSLELVAQIGDDDIWDCHVYAPASGTYRGTSSNGNDVTIRVAATDADTLVTRWDWYGDMSITLKRQGETNTFVGELGSPTHDDPGGFDLQRLDVTLRPVQGKWTITYSTEGVYFNGDGSVAPDFSEEGTLIR